MKVKTFFSKIETEYKYEIKKCETYNHKKTKKSLYLILYCYL